SWHTYSAKVAKVVKKSRKRKVKRRAAARNVRSSVSCSEAGCCAAASYAALLWLNYSRNARPDLVVKAPKLQLRILRQRCRGIRSGSGAVNIAGCSYANGATVQ